MEEYPEETDVVAIESRAARFLGSFSELNCVITIRRRSELRMVPESGALAAPNPKP